MNASAPLASEVGLADNVTTGVTATEVLAVAVPPLPVQLSE